MSSAKPGQRFIKRNGYKGKNLAVFTSGGDSQGMNAALRAVVRTSCYLGIKSYFIKEGYQGMVDGGENIIEADWISVSSIIHLAGTTIGSARCAAFRTKEGRLQAARNLLDREINHLVVIGGDGSLTGANTFRQEWSDLINELSENGYQFKSGKSSMSYLNIVGIVGSIDNDFAGTDVTIGFDSAMNRIIEAVDSIKSTATSHQRAFVMEVMGRNCGYLALKAGIACEADFIFIPEDPPEGDWRKVMCAHVSEARGTGKRISIIMASEGALDSEGNVISTKEIKDTLVERLDLDVRLTVLGHVQRGGCPSAFDRILACKMGAEAVLALMDATSNTEPCVICLRNSLICRIPLMQAVEKTQAVTKAMKEKNWALAVQLRGPSFLSNLSVYKTLFTASGGGTQRLSDMTDPALVSDTANSDSPNTTFRIGVMHIGSPACGMNATVQSFVRTCTIYNFSVVGIVDGISGLLNGDIKELRWSNVTNWSFEGGASLGTNKKLPSDNFAEIAQRLRQFKIQALLFIGGFEAYHACGLLYDHREMFKEFCIPLLVIPASISNNIPGTSLCIGVDTCLNSIVHICDRLRQSAQGVKHRVYIIETMGKYCGYLATTAALASGADSAYIFEEKFDLQELQQNIQTMAAKMKSGVSRGLVIVNENASVNYSSDLIRRIYSEEGSGQFSCRLNVLGHTQQGGIPSPYDRNLGCKFGTKCVEWFNTQFKEHSKPNGAVYCTNKESACLIGYVKSSLRYTPLEDLIEETDFKYRFPKEKEWLELRPLLSVLSKYVSASTEDGVYFPSIDPKQTQNNNQTETAICSCSKTKF